MLFVVFFIISGQCVSGNMGSYELFVYTRQELMALRPSAVSINSNNDIPPEISAQPRRRGKRAGVRRRYRKRW